MEVLPFNPLDLHFVVVVLDEDGEGPPRTTASIPEEVLVALALIL